MFYSSSSSSLPLKSSSTSSILPNFECTICAKRGHGFHFGVVTCRACASFFSRSIGQKKTYKCLRGDKCDIKQVGARKVCRACRLQACIQAGMQIEEESSQKSLNSIFQQIQSRNAKIQYNNEITEENAPTLFKFMRGYRSFLDNQKSAFIVKHPDLVFQNISMIDADQKETANSMIEAKPLMFTMLNENVEPFGLMPHEKKVGCAKKCEIHKKWNIHFFFF